jgi:predicted metal-binding membrane protein
MAIVHRPRRGVPDGLLFGGVAATAWAVALLALATGRDVVLHHDALVGSGGLPSAGALLVFLLAWQVMTAAMMLPSSLPLLRLFARACAGQPHPRLARLAFVTAYFAIWTGFAVAALVADAGLHRLVHSWPWLHERPWLIAGTVLLLAGGFQFSPLKERCLWQCRSPFGFLQRHYRRGLRAAGTLGLRHGLFCLGCCWALMLTMFAVGVGQLAWMAGLTGVMVIEKTSRWGRRLTPVVGATLLIWGLLVLAHPAWLPTPLSLAVGGD